MGKLDRLFGMAAKALDLDGNDRREPRPAAHDRTAPPSARDPYAPPPAPGAPAPAAPRRVAAGTDADRAAIARYDYLLQTAEPGQLEQVHRDAFERLTPEQRQQVAARLRAELPPNEQPVTDSPEQLARTATRGEARQPGFLKKVFASGGARTAGAAGAGMAAGLGIGAAGGLLAAVAGGAVLSSVAAPLLAQATDLGVDFDQFAGGFDEFTGGAGDLMSSASEQVSGLGEGFEFPGLGDLGGFFDR